MRRLFFEVSPRLRWVMVLLAALPCVPGLTFLLAGWWRDPGRLAASDFPAAEYQRAAMQAHGLYRAGSVATMAGMLLGTVVVWQVLRAREESEDEDEELPPG